MNRTLLLALVASAAVGGYFFANPPVELQPATPGLQQVGNVNVSGKVIAGSLSASNSSPTAQVIVGNATSTTGANYAGLFRTGSSAGTGIRGVATAATGNANGGTFQTASPSGAGVRGFSTAATGVNYGVYGQAVSPSGFAGFFQGRLNVTGDVLFGGVMGGNGFGLTNLNANNIAAGTLNSARLPVPLSLSGSDPFPIVNVEHTGTGTALRGYASASTGVTVGVRGQSASSGGIGVTGSATADTGVNFGGFFGSASPNGIGLFVQNDSGAVALQTLGITKLNGDTELLGSSKLGIGAGAPIFPLDFGEGLGDRISLWGTDPNSHYGLGVQSGVLQVYADAVGSATAFGHGGSANFTERVRFAGDAEMIFRASNEDVVSSISVPYDLLLKRDRDDDDSDAWLRVYTNGGNFEQMRIDDGDEAVTKFDGAVTANGIDFAEAFKVTDSSLEPGDLVINHGTDWQYITRSRGAYDQGVIGVISTKPAFIAGMSFDAEDNINPDLTKRRDEARRKKDEKLEKRLTLEMRELVRRAYRPVAFMGRVPVKVTGPVRLGDHLTASNLPGIAMTMTRPGQSVGIALEANPGGLGQVMVMVQPGFFAPMAASEGGANAELSALKSKLDRVLAENSDLRSRLDRLERAVSKR